MSYDLKFSTIIHASRPDVFNYFTDPVLLECWCYPDGMTLKVPFFENNLHGRYRYEHTNAEGKTFICEGVIEGYETNRRLLTIDSVVDGEGNKIFENLKTDIVFLEDSYGCKIEVFQTGFNSVKDAEECRIGWHQCLDRLNSVFTQFQDSSL